VSTLERCLSVSRNSVHVIEMSNLKRRFPFSKGGHICEVLVGDCSVFGQRLIYIEHAHLGTIPKRVRSNQKHDSGDEVKFEKL